VFVTFENVLELKVVVLGHIFKMHKLQTEGLRRDNLFSKRNGQLALALYFELA